MIIFVPGAVIATITFPGVILHEMAHKFFCDLYRIPVYEVKYFAVSKNAGHVIHAPITDVRKNAIIGLAPLLINSVACILFLIPEFLPVISRTSFVSTYSFHNVYLIWIGLSCGLNALPSKTDLASIDNNISWPLFCIKKLAQILNFGGLAGNFIWFMILLVVSMSMLMIFALILLGLMLTLEVFLGLFY